MGKDCVEMICKEGDGINLREEKQCEKLRRKKKIGKVALSQVRKLSVS